MARNTPPTLSSYTEVASWGTAGSSKSTASVSWNTGDVVVVVAGCEGIGTLGTAGVPTATGLTFTGKWEQHTASRCSSLGAYAVAGSSSSGAVSCANSSASLWWGFGVWVFSGSDGIGSFAEQHTTTHTVSFTPTDTHSAVAYAAFDFSAANVSGNDLTPTPTNLRQENFNASHYAWYVGDIPDVASGSAASYGLNAGGTTGAISIGLVEVLGTTSGGGGTTVKKLAALGVG